MANNYILEFIFEKEDAGMGLIKYLYTGDRIYLETYDDVIEEVIRRYGDIRFRVYRIVLKYVNESNTIVTKVLVENCQLKLENFDNIDKYKTRLQELKMIEKLRRR